MRRYDAARLRDAGHQTFDVMRADDGARIVIAANGDFEQLAYQSDDQYVVEIQPRAQGRRAAPRRSANTPASA